MNVLGAVVAALVSTLVMTMMLVVAPRMGVPKMDIAGMPGTMFVSKKQTATAAGMSIHYMLGVVLASIYALL